MKLVRLADVGARTDDRGAAFAGSQLQTQLYVNRRTADLNSALVDAFPELGGAELEWRSPLEADGYAEFYGSAFLARVGLSRLAVELASSWPARGPQWDALAVAGRKSEPTILLIEGKSYPDEMLKGAPCASEPGTPNRAQIDTAIAWTQEQLGVEGRSVEDWTGSLYQNANRLAHLVWLRSLGIDALFAHLLFLDDSHHRTSADEWDAAIAEADDLLGLTGVKVAGAGHVLLPAGTREDLVGP